MIYDLSFNVAEAIPYSNHRHKNRLVNSEIEKGRYVEVWHDKKLIYSAEKWRGEDGTKHIGGLE